MRQRFAIALIVILPLIAWQVRATPETAAQYLSSTKWNLSEDWFGGFSGLEVRANGRGFLAITDRGQIVQGDLIREKGQIADVKIESRHKLKAKSGDLPVYARRDTEGLAIDGDGSLFVSVEGIHRVWTYKNMASKAAALPRHRDFWSLEDNGSLEALALDKEKRIYVIPERRPLKGKGIPVYRYDNQEWSLPFYLPRNGRYLAVGADFGPDGKLYVLERRFVGVGFRSRVRRFDVTPNGLGPEDVVLESLPGQHDNLEGLSVWRDDAGHIRLTMISDDNFLFYQKTEIVEYILHAAT